MGRDVSRLAMREMPFDDFVSYGAYGCRDKLSGVIGATKADAVIKWFSVTENADFVEKLMNTCSIIDCNNIDDMPKSAASGITFAVTGKLVHYQSRDELIAVIEGLGGKVSGSVSSKTGFLINNDTGSQSGKNRKAKELGIPIISEDEFMDRFLA
jgi:DNA ligase (NAD+)